MEALLFMVLVLALTLPLRLLAIRVIDHADSPEYFRRHGVIVKRLEALDDVGEVLGLYRGGPIYGSLGFKGMHYEFAGVVPPEYKQRIKRCQLSFIKLHALYNECLHAGRTASRMTWRR